MMKIGYFLLASGLLTQSYCCACGGASQNTPLNSKPDNDPLATEIKALIDEIYAKDWLPSMERMILAVIYACAFGTRLFSVIRFESVIHEFDPWFNYRATRYLVENGWYAFLNWFDERSWYPLGRVVGTTVYPGLMITSAAIDKVLNSLLALNLDIRDICVFLAPVFSGLTAMFTYLLTKELTGGSAPLLAAAFMGICPGYISRSVAGSYDNEAISITLMMAIFLFWVRAVKKGSAFYAVLSAAFYYYLTASWGGYLFIANLIPLHTVALLAAGRYSHRLYIAYSTWYVLGALSAMTIPFVNLHPALGSEHLPSIGVFCLVQLAAFLSVAKGLVDNEKQFRAIAATIVLGCGSALVACFALMVATGKVGPWAGRFMSLWDTSYAKKHSPIIASVSEHQPTSWGSFFFDMNLLMFAAPAGFFLCARMFQDEHIFALVYAVSASYFAAVMIRLMLTLSPIFCVLGAVAFGNVIDTFAKVNKAADSNKSAKSNIHGRVSVLGVVAALLIYYARHCTWVTINGYSSPSIMLATPDPRDPSQTRIIDDFREAFYWLRRNTPYDSKVLSWWDYGYQLAGMSDRITMVDNNTWSTRHIATIGKALTLPEERSYPVLRQLEADYVLALTGVLNGFQGDDPNKLYWITRITAAEFPDELNEADYFGPSGGFRLDAGAPEGMRSAVLYKLCYLNMQRLLGAQGRDRVRGFPLQGIDPKINILHEVYTSENFIFRIFKVKRPDPLGRSLFIS